MNGSNAYGSSVSATTQYNAATHLSFINSYLTPIKNTITNDSKLTSTQKGILLQVFQNINSNFSTLSSLVTNTLTCFPDTPNMGANSNRLGDGAVTKGWVGRFLKKAINVYVTIQVSIIEKIVIGAVWGSVIAHPIPGGAIGAVIGGFVGLFDGISKYFAGNYICVFEPCN